MKYLMHDPETQGLAKCANCEQVFGAEYIWTTLHASSEDRFRLCRRCYNVLRQKQETMRTPYDPMRRPGYEQLHPADVYGFRADAKLRNTSPQRAALPPNADLLPDSPKELKRRVKAVNLQARAA